MAIKTFKLYPYRHVARVVIEAVTPFRIGSGDKDLTTDSSVLRDANGLPYIPGTTLAGVFRSYQDKEKSKGLYGFQSGTEGCGSRIIFSDAKLLDGDGNPVDCFKDISSDIFLKNFSNLPVRQHVCISHLGTSIDKGKFDKEIVYKGTRFAFEVEYLAEDENENLLQDLLLSSKSEYFRIGSSTRNGLGQFKLEKLFIRKINLKKQDDLEAYLNKTSSLTNNTFWKDITDISVNTCTDTKIWNTYNFYLKPVDFILFGSGKGDENGDADTTPVKENVIEWNNENKATIKETVIIPTSSIKGAIAHRVAFHYNKYEGKYCDEITDFENYTGSNNHAVRKLFGSIQNADKEKEAQRGNVLFSDIYFVNCKWNNHLFNHVVIDNFSGGSINGGLFTEQAIYTENFNPEDKEDYKINFSISVNSYAFDGDENVLKALTETFNDLCNGMLPIGGSTNKGHGLLQGKWEPKE